MKPRYKSVTDPYIVVWAFVLAGLCAAGALYSHFIIGAFRTNPVLNTAIWAVSLFGIVLIAYHMWTVAREKHWLYSMEAFYREQSGQESMPQQSGLLAALFQRLDAAGSFSPEAETPESIIESELDQLRGLLAHRLEAAEFIAGTMIGLGLLGTFIGLLETLVKTSDVIAAIAASISASADLTEQFRKMVHDLQGPLAGMGTAFSASLFGLLGSMILGLMVLIARGNGQDLVRRTRALLLQHTRVATGAAPALRTDDNLRLMLAELMAENRKNAASIARLADESRSSAESVALLSHTMERYAARLDEHASSMTQLHGDLKHLGHLPETLERLASELAAFQLAGRSQENLLNNAVMSLHNISQSMERQAEKSERMDAGLGDLLHMLDANLVSPVSDGLKQTDARLGGMLMLMERHLDQSTMAIDMMTAMQREVQLNSEAVKTAVARNDAQTLERSRELIASIEHIGGQMRQWSESMAQGLEGLTKRSEQLNNFRSLAEKQLDLDETRVQTMCLLLESFTENSRRLVDAGRQLQHSLEEYRRAVPGIKEHLHSVDVSMARLQVGIASLKRTANEENVAE